jgi:hypothetical protein
MLKNQLMNENFTEFIDVENPKAKMIYSNEPLDYLVEMYKATQIINKDKLKDLKTKILDYCKERNPIIVVYLKYDAMLDIQNYFIENEQLLPPSKTHMEQYAMYVVLHIQEQNEDLHDYINWAFYQTTRDQDYQQYMNTYKRNHKNSLKGN